MDKRKDITRYFFIFLFFLTQAGALPLCADEKTDEAEKYFQEARYKQALDAYSGIIEEDPKQAKAYRRRANCFEQLGDYEKALADYDKAISSDRTHFEAYYDKALLLYNTLQKKKDAYDTLSKAIQVGYSKKEDKGPLAKIHIFRSYIYRSKGDNQNAVKDITHALYYVPDPLSFIMRGEVRKEMEQYALARIDFKKALSLLDSGDEQTEELKEFLRRSIEECEEEIARQEKENAEKEAVLKSSVSSPQVPMENKENGTPDRP